MMPVDAVRPPGSRSVVGIGEFAVSSALDHVIVTHALGSCIAVCVWDPVAHVGGLLHFLLPDSRINTGRASQQPGAFADTGIPLLFQTAYERGLIKTRAIVRLVGGAEIASDGNGTLLNVGRRNVQAARNLLWRNGVLIRGEELGGNVPRNVVLSIADGSVRVTSGRESVVRL